MHDIIKNFVYDYYLQIKTAHLLFVIAWMSGIFYFPRLLVYHHEAPIGSQMDKTFQIMEKKLYKIIMVPGMHISLLLGLFLSMISGTWSQGWFHLKFLCVLLLMLFQSALNYWRKEFLKGNYPKTPKFFRIINEVPTFLLLIILICVIIKPF